MTHILVLFDGDAGEFNSLPHLLRYFQQKTYEVTNEDGSREGFNAQPRILLPMHFRLDERIKDQFLADIKQLGGENYNGKLSKIPFLKFLGINKIDMDKIEANAKVAEYRRQGGKDGVNMESIHVYVLGEVKDLYSQSGRELI